MTAVTPLASYDLIGKKEDVSDIITNITPTKTPFLSSLKSEKVKNIFYQWQEDSLRAVQVNAQVEGFTATDNTLTPTLMRNNTTQILNKVFRVTGTAEELALYGRAKESAYQMVKAGEEVKRDLENALIGTQQAINLGSDGSARNFAGYQAMIDASSTVAAAAGTATAPLTENLLLQTLQALYNNGVEATTVSIKPADATKVANFSYASGRFREQTGGDKTITNAVDVYDSPFGTVRIGLNRFLNAGNALVYDPSYWRLVSFRPWFREVLAKDGDSLRQMIVGEYGLKHLNYQASGLITNLS